MDTTLEAGTRLLDQYELLHRLGEGGIGEVWLAHDTRLDRDVAIKMLLGDPSRRTIQRFEREAQLTAKLSHPNIVTIHNIAEQNGKLFIVMEYVEAGNLESEVSQRGAMSWRDATEAVCDAAKGLAMAHERGMVHRDIKPSNLMRSSNGIVKLVDFGLARSVESDLEITQAGTLLGTPLYMAPEQCRGDAADARSDLYSLICTYFKLLTRRSPFTGKTAAEVMHRHVTAMFPDARDFARDLPDSVLRVIARGSQKSPSARHQSAAELIAELEAVLSASEQSHTYETTWSDVLQVMSADDPDGLSMSLGGAQAGGAPAAGMPRPRFKVTVQPRAADGYPVLIEAPPVPFGSPSGVVVIDPSGLAPDVDRIRHNQCGREFVERFGSELFKKLLPGRLATGYELNIKHFSSFGPDATLSVQLQILAPDLRFLPWEALFDPTEQRWLATDSRTPLSRYVEAPSRGPSELQLPLKILVAVAAPSDLPKPAAKAELSAMIQALKPMLDENKVSVRQVKVTGVESLRKGLESFRPHALHFIGHGNRRGNVFGLSLVGPDGTSDFVDVDVLRELMDNAGSLRAVVINACESVGVAYALAERGLAAIGMHEPIHDDSAVKFCETLYRAIAASQPLDVAVNTARFALRIGRRGERIDWCIPVVFLPGGRADLFHFDSATPAEQRPSQQDPKQKQKQEAAKRTILRVTSDPTGALIHVDGRSSGYRTPHRLAVPGGSTHVLWVSLAGYTDPAPQRIPADGPGPVNVEFDLKPVGGDIIVRTPKPGMKVTLHDLASDRRWGLGITDARGQLGPVPVSPGRFEVRGWMPDARKPSTRGSRVEVTSGTSYSVTLEQKKLLASPAVWVSMGALVALVAVVITIVMSTSLQPESASTQAGPVDGPDIIEPPVVDPPPAAPTIETVAIPAGKLTSGNWEPIDLLEAIDLWRKHDSKVTDADLVSAVARLRSTRTMRIDAFDIDEYEVTNDEYGQFLAEIKKTRDHSRCHPSESKNQDHNQHRSVRNWAGNLPVVGINWYDAYAYAAWAGKRLPTADEWEIAARGRQSRLYPWGNTFDPAYSPVGKRPIAIGDLKRVSVESPVGMGGNVAEWTSTVADPAECIVKGGGVTRPGRYYAIASQQKAMGVTNVSVDVGFRCVSNASGGTPPGMIRVPGGTWRMVGRQDKLLKIVEAYPEFLATLVSRIKQHPRRSSHMGAFRIGRFEVTNEEYRVFLDFIAKTGDHSKCHPAEPHQDHTPNAGTWLDPRFAGDRQPVVGVDWYDAYAFAQWVGGRLPTGREWEYAARGSDDRRLYPWGDEFVESACHGSQPQGSGRTLDVGSIAADRSPFGVMDMAGNAQEWTADNVPNRRGWMLLRGGAWKEPHTPILALVSVTEGAAVDYEGIEVGFRVVFDAAGPE